MITKIKILANCFSLLGCSVFFSMNISLIEAYVYLYGLTKPYRITRPLEGRGLENYPDC